jgi:hypothetical protein
VFQKGLDDPSILKSLIWRIQVDKYYDIFFSSSLPVHGHRIPQDFPPDLARDLIQEFCPKPSSKILDPCHGWGGRALGFLLADNASYYEAYDVSEKKHKLVFLK